MNKSIKIPLPLDSDGFLSQECPECVGIFKAKFTKEPTGKTLSFCPYCGHEGRNCWWTKEQIEYINSIQRNEILNPLIRGFQEDIKRFDNPRAGFHVNTPPIKDEPVHKPTELNAEWPLIRFACCDETIKYRPGEKELHCIICGSLQAS